LAPNPKPKKFLLSKITRQPAFPAAMDFGYPGGRTSPMHTMFAILKSSSLLVGYGTYAAIGLGVVSAALYVIGLSLSLHKMSISAPRESHVFQVDVYLFSTMWTGQASKFKDGVKEYTDPKLSEAIVHVVETGARLSIDGLMQIVCTSEMKKLWHGCCAYFGKVQNAGLLLLTCAVLNTAVADVTACYLMYLHSTREPLETRKRNFVALLCSSWAAMLVPLMYQSWALHSWSADTGSIISTSLYSGCRPGEFMLYFAWVCQAFQLVLSFFATPTTAQAQAAWLAREKEQVVAGDSPQGGYGTAERSELALPPRAPKPGRA